MLQVYIKMDRMDMATKVLKKMQEIDDDSVLTNLSQAWLHLAMVAIFSLWFHFHFVTYSILTFMSDLSLLEEHFCSSQGIVSLLTGFFGNGDSNDVLFVSI